jgi:hypothetical protein
LDSRQPRLAALVLLVSGALAACGGGGDDTAEATISASSSAATSTTSESSAALVAGAPAAAGTDSAADVAAESADPAAESADESAQPTMQAAGYTPLRPAPAAPKATTTSTSVAQQIAAATATAQTNPNCTRAALGDYYWEIGDASGVIASGAVGTTVASTTALPIESATKWIYASYAVQALHGVVPAQQVPYLNFTSGYTNMTDRCLQTDTVSSCIARTNGTQNPASVGYFYYNSGHMQVHAANFMGQGPSPTATLNTSIVTPMLATTKLAAAGYSSPLMAGAIYTSASTYATFLRSILSGSLLMKNVLGSNKVCTNPYTCSTARFSPMQTSGESWNYSLGHWVEDDPLVGDHAFSSAGMGGFYPWIDQTKTYYGVVARQVNSPGTFQGYVSAKCGRLIRQAFVTGVTVTSTTPTPTASVKATATH